MNSFSQTSEYPVRTVSNFLGKFAEKFCTTGGVVDTGGKWKKSSIRKALIVLIGHQRYRVPVAKIYPPSRGALLLANITANFRKNSK
jgi:hypothetical protein